MGLNIRRGKCRCAQAKAAQSTVVDNVMFNAPRNGVTFNDPMGGGDIVTGNLAFSALRETADGGTYNSWDRQPFLTTTLTGEPSPFMAWREISYNFFVNNYHMAMSWVMPTMDTALGREGGVPRAHERARSHRR